MKNRTAFYVKPKEEQEKLLKFKFGSEKTELSCLKKKYFDKKNDGDRLAGYVHLRNRKYTGKEYGTLENAAGESIDIYSKKKLCQGIAGYICTEEGELLGVTRNYLLLLLLFLGAALAGIALFCLLRFTPAEKETEQEVLPPDFNVVVDEEEDDCNCDIKVQVTLPDGEVDFEGEIDTPEDEKKKAEDESSDGEGDYEPYSGQATVRVTLTLDGTEHLLLDTTEVEIENGELPNVYLDFTKIDFELQPGIYYGFVYIVYKDGSAVTKPIRIVILDKESGKVGIGYSDQLYVYTEEDRISMKYVCQDSTTDTIVQVIVKSGDQELLLAQSGIIRSGDMIRELPLDGDAKKRLQAGSYRGVMRVYFNDSAETGSADIRTDIECTINVQ